MSPNALLLSLAFAVSSFTPAAYGHHSFAATYAQGKPVTLEGRVVEFTFRNPHSVLNFEVTDKNGKKMHWAGEWGSVTQLTENGVTKFVLKPGDKITVDGFPAHDPNHHRVLIRSLLRPATGARPEFKWTAEDPGL